MDYSHYTQSATYWAPSGNDGYGARTFASPVALTVRWEDIQQTYSNKHGDTKVSQSKVWVQQDVVTEGYLYLGTSSDADPTGVDGAYEIKAFIKIPSTDGTEFERKALL